MQSRESLEAYRALSPGERLKIVLKMSNEGLKMLRQGTPEQVARRFERLRAENEARNKNMLEALERSLHQP